jgi:hypothetical protein
MKINYKNTALNLLDKWDEEINVPESNKPMTKEQDKEFAISVLRQLEKSGDLFRNKIQYISQPFIDAYWKGRHKLASIFDKEDIEETGTWLWAGGSFTYTNFYYLKTWVEDDIWKSDYCYIQFSKHSQNDFKSIDIYVSGRCIDEHIHEKTFIWKGHWDKGCDHTHYHAFLVSFICFMKYCEVETKIIGAGKKEKFIGTKYLNETNRKIEIVDSTWFTTIVKSEGFHVRGHFRFQPFGEGLKNKKLIWISDFEKAGYTKKAKVLGLRQESQVNNQNDNT